MKYAILFPNFATRQPRVFILFFQNSTLLDNSLYSLSTMAQIASNIANQNAAAQPKQIYIYILIKNIASNQIMLMSLLDPLQIILILRLDISGHWNQGKIINTLKSNPLKVKPTNKQTNEVELTSFRNNFSEDFFGNLVCCR